MKIQSLAAAAALALGLGATPAAALAAPSPHLETAVLAGGCFWGMEEVFERLNGVTDVTAGYAGGNAATAHYEIVSTGTTGHAESIRVTFDPARISYATLLNVYFTVAHDPTELDYQGPDHGPQYRSEIYYLTDAQKATALAAIRHLTAQHAFGAPIVTKVEAYRGFFPAEAYHQHYADLHPDDPYIVNVDGPKVAQLQARYASLVKPDKPRA
jgi:peptide-methionine (S)-S-oxide reductase